MSRTLQPSNDERATVFSIAWDIVKRDISTCDARYTSEQIGSMIAHTVARMIREPLPEVLDQIRCATPVTRSTEIEVKDE